MASLGALLSGYGSGSDSDSGRDEVVEDALGVSPSSGPESTADAIGALPGETRSLTATSQLSSGHNAGPERLTSRLPIRTALLAKAAEDSGDDDDEPKKRLKLTKGRKSILDTLPPPTQVLQATPRTQALNNDTSTGPAGRQFAAELPDPEPAESGMYELEQTAEPLVMGPPEARPAMATAGGGDVGPAHTGWYEPAEHAAWTGQDLCQDQTSHHGPADSRGASSSDGDALLRAAIEAEENRAKKAGRPGLSGVQFKEVNADKLKQVAPGARDGNEELRAALGPGYEAKVRAQAGPLPSKMAKRKHQIGSLYHAAKMRELDMMQARGQGLKSKAETQAKYGWA